MRLLVEYKFFFEPGFYSTDLPDWGTAYAVCVELGPQAKALVDTGHRAQGVNVEQIIASLLGRGRCAREVAYMIDQSHNIEPKVEAMVQSVVNIQIAHGKALLSGAARRFA